MTARRMLITGCTRGCGRALAAWAITRGHAVAGCGTDAERVTGFAADFPAARCRSVDVSDAEAVEAWTAELIGLGFVPDLIVNNAALINDPAPVWEIPAQAFDRIIDVNIKGVANVIRSWMPKLITAGHPAVIANLSSGWGRSTSPEVAPYCATKFAVEGLSQAMAQEVPKGFAVVAVNPGIIRTDMLARCFGEDAESYPTPAEWAENAGPFFLGLSAKDNGGAVSCP